MFALCGAGATEAVGGVHAHTLPQRLSALRFGVRSAVGSLRSPLFSSSGCMNGAPV